MMPIIQKHLVEKRRAKQTETNRFFPVPQTYTEDEQEFIDMMTPTDPEDLKQEKGENDDDFWERKSLAMLPKYDYLTPDLKRAKYVISPSFVLFLFLFLLGIYNNTQLGNQGETTQKLRESCNWQLLVIPTK